MSFLNQILYPETCDASRFVESLELPIKLQGCGVLSTRGFTRSVFYQTINCTVILFFIQRQLFTAYNIQNFYE